ncbi:MAG: hypothetical protein RBS08_07600 [Bdellovibrionales bacterium]|jgi:hypothetical protein|nr:hypothetical protein [Bdellovibrionales bacterium]
MTAPQKQYAQYVWEDVQQNTVKRTFGIPNQESAIAFGIKNNATYFTTYTASAPDDALADKSPRIYTCTQETELLTAAQIIDHLEQYKSVRHLREHLAGTLPRMFARVSGDTSLQEKFTQAAAKPDATEKFDAILDLLRQEKPEQVFLIPNSAGYIRMEAGNESYGADGKRRYPAPK